MKEFFGIPANLKRTRSLFVLFPCCKRQVYAVNAVLQKATGFLFSIFLFLSSRKVYNKRSRIIVEVKKGFRLQAIRRRLSLWQIVQKNIIIN